MTIPQNFTRVDPHSKIILNKNDQICMIGNKPWWLPAWLSNIINKILAWCPGINRLTVSYNGEYHYLKLEKAYTDGDSIYMIYRMTSDIAPVIVIVIAAGALLLSFINGYLTAVAIRKQTGVIGQSLFSLGLLALVVAFAVYAWRRWIALPGRKK